ncbi:Hypothetical_protein [Hexamita inflata]|nr:Hypothetical protein HINF_LOCUS38850 [Hexamita inflata]
MQFVNVRATLQISGSDKRFQNYIQMDNSRFTRDLKVQTQSLHVHQLKHWSGLKYVRFKMCVNESKQFVFYFMFLVQLADNLASIYVILQFVITYIFKFKIIKVKKICYCGYKGGINTRDYLDQNIEFFSEIQ